MDDVSTNNQLFLQNDRTYNVTMIISLINTSHRQNTNQQEYDDTGALYYVIAVVLMYGFSIILMIGSSIKKSKNDNGVRKYMKDLDKVKRLARRQEKFKTRLVMNGKRYWKVLGSDRAVVSIREPCTRGSAPEETPEISSDATADIQGIECKATVHCGTNESCSYHKEDDSIV